jgi:excisionase family DNA binding protein
METSEVFSDKLLEVMTMAETVAEQVLTVEEVAEMLRCPRSTVYRLIEEEGLPAFRVGRRYRVLSTLLIGWMEEHSRPENDTWSHELDALSAAMRADLLAKGITSENLEDQIAQAVERVQAQRMNQELMELL